MFGVEVSGKLNLLGYRIAAYLLSRLGNNKGQV
jgi:hypothetical protein